MKPQKTQNDYSTFNIPTFSKEEAYDFNSTNDFFEVYQELNQISQEIDKCRLRNL